MAHHQSIQIEAHPNIYTGQTRSLRIDYAIPDHGITKETAMLLLVPGYLGHIDANVYQKMRRRFADQYNLIVVQCAYFGDPFMQKPDMYEVIDGRAVLHESIDEFNDMGWMQAIDLVTAMCAIRARHPLVSQRVIGYGHSHGAFLLYVANRLYPLFTYIIDNCARLRTDYFEIDRVEQGIHFTFMAKQFVQHPERLDLARLLNTPQLTQVLALQGDEDPYVNHIEKQQVLSIFPNLQYELITANKVDGIRFKSNTHGLDADFLKVFDYAMTIEKPLLAAHNLHLNDTLPFGILIQKKGLFPHFQFQQGI